MELSKAVLELEKDLLAIKAAQKTQNDSFQLYRYRSDNIFFTGNTECRFTCTFLPDRKDDSLICEWQLGQIAMAIQYYAQMVVDTKDPCKATLDIYGAPSGVPSWAQVAYISCISNRKGTLTVTRSAL